MSEHRKSETEAPIPIEALQRVLRAAEIFEEEGPLGDGWQSPELYQELHDAVEAVRVWLEAVTPKT